MTTAAPKATKTVADAILSRRSIRKYTDDAIPTEDLELMVELAGRAPTFFNVQPTRFVVVREPELKAKLQAVAYNQPQVGSAAAVFVLYSDMQDVLANVEEILHPGMQGEQREGAKARFLGSFEGKTEAEIEQQGLTQANIALGYLLVAAEGLGYGTSPMLGFEADKVKALLGIPEHAHIPAIVSVGVPAEEGFTPHRHAVSRILREAK